ncbi:MAG: NAD(P)H-dependent oxidoreductase [Candidatus Omnitrophica bacterium]|nr:NAD(P)H-dependent oxidoreductase [Candidatus Omnitrophota bacterium]MDD5437283.1 NAD(P)H-dependent oxidoreductase [Candidatus Omnitrophota bacterium]
MNKLLHIIAAPRGDDSRTLKVSGVFLDNFIKKYPSCLIEEVKLFEETLPPLTLKVISGKYVLLGGGSLDEKLKTAWKDVERYIEQFLSADTYLISTPMWNFSIPYWLKQYIDVIVQPKYLFRYTASGAEGLVKDKKMVVITSRGGDYRPGSPSAPYDHQEPYLRAVFGLCGIREITFVNAQPMDMGQPLQEKALDEAKASAKKAAELS